MSARQVHPYHAELEAAGHRLKRGEDGEIDTFVMASGYHNGPGCEVCGESWCHHCESEVRPCPGPYIPPSQPYAWFVKFRVGDEVRFRAYTHNAIADHLAIDPNATVTPIDCAAVEHLLTAARDVVEMEDEPRFLYGAIGDLRAALAAFRSTP